MQARTTPSPLLWRNIALTALLLLATAATSGCGAHIRQAQEEHARLYEEIHAIPLPDILAGRSAEDVLNAALPRANCTWMEKGFLSGSENCSGYLGHDYDAATQRLTVRLFYVDAWSPWEDRRITAEISMNLKDLNVYVEPADPLSGFKCWVVDINCREGHCIQVDKYTQLIGKNSVRDESERHYQHTFWGLNFGTRQDALEAYAAMQTIAGPPVRKQTAADLP